MHEASLVAELLRLVAQDAAARGFCSVETVHIEIGEWSGANPAALMWAFATVKHGTVCDGAQLEITAAPAGDQVTLLGYIGR